MQTIRESALSEACDSPVNANKIDDDNLKTVGSQYEGSVIGEFLEGLSGSKGHGMYIEKHLRTWEAPTTPE
jgi:hypothetical protein